jgi:hypothetical protein
MPKIVPMIPSEVLLREFDRLSPSLLLVPEQVAMVTGATPERLREERRAGKPPPFVSDGKRVHYVLGVVRDHVWSRIKSETFHSTRDAQRAAANREAGLDVELLRDKSPIFRFSSFGDFLTQGGLDDQWPFTIVAGKPIDFFASLAMGSELPTDGVACGWLSLDEYLMHRRQAAHTEASALQPKN